MKKLRLRNTPISLPLLCGGFRDAMGIRPGLTSRERCIQSSE